MDQKLVDALKNHGVSESFQEKLAGILPDNVQEKLSGLLQRYQELNEEGKKEFMSDALDKFKTSVYNKVSSNSSLYTRLWLSHSYTIFFVALILIVFVLVFFVYKLFKCLSEREMKREEKKRSKQLKKKK